MSGFGTDIVALACIVGSAATSGAVTLAFLDGGENVKADCAVEAFTVSPNLIVSGRSGARTVVMRTPQLRLHSAHDCGVVVTEGVQIHMQDVRQEVERVRVRVEVARAEAEAAREGVEIFRVQADEARALIEEARAEMEETRGEMEEGRAEDLADHLRETELLLEVVKKVSGVQTD